MHKPVLNAVSDVFEQIRSVLQCLKDSEYSNSLEILSGSSIGQHTRHVLDMFLCLQRDYHAGIIHYENRQRNAELETRIVAAEACLGEILHQLVKEDKPLLIAFSHKKEFQHTESTYHRELIYCLEHSVHHLALVKVGLLGLKKTNVPKDLGVAESTQQYRKSVGSAS